MKDGKKPNIFGVLSGGALLLPAGLLCLPFDFPRALAEETFSEFMAKAKEIDKKLGEHDPLKGCSTKFIKEFEKFASSQRKQSLEKMDPSLLCEKNLEAGHNKLIDAKLKNLKISEIGQEVKIESNGACEATYEAIKKTFQLLATARMEACEQTATAQKGMHACLSASEKSGLGQKCDEEFKRTINATQEIKQKLVALGENTFPFLDQFPKYNVDSKRKYEMDAGRFRELQINPSLAPNTINQSSVSLSSGTLEAKDGNATNLREYAFKLGIDGPQHSLGIATGPIRALSLGAEQDEAKETMENFRKTINEIQEKDKKDLDDALAGYQKKLNNSKPPSLGSLVTTAGPGVAQVASTLSGKQSPTPINTSASSLPPFGGAALGAAALALSGASGKMGSPPSTNGGGGHPIDKGASNPSPTGLNNNDLGPGADKEDKNKKNPDEPILVASAPTTNSTGSALFSPQTPSRKRKPTAFTNEKNSPPAYTQGEDYSSFQKNLTPPARPPASQTPSSEFSEVLKSIKDLFVEPHEGGGPPPMQTALENFEGASSQDEDMLAENYTHQTEVAFDQNQQTKHAEKAKLTGGASLFVRMKYRTTNCIEKGLVFNGLGGIPE